MANYDNTNTGIISKNTRKTQDTHADISGSVNVEGVEYFVDGWLKERNDGSGKFYSLKLKPKQARQQGEGQESNKGGRDFDDADSIPF
ncbi:hypothetical protein [Aurantimonas coralicida]|uniref:hypothetical protein n=1 Tax=Aurantimonas coralicida TaxID=182270 RepID=UPI001E5AFDBA|nr:hypothetical protein [Aurantimonas coralicida]MCD1645186.1 hypothetical protein [Aurantimonas coralicida]